MADRTVGYYQALREVDDLFRDGREKLAEQLAHEQHQQQVEAALSRGGSGDQQSQSNDELDRKRHAETLSPEQAAGMQQADAKPKERTNAEKIEARREEQILQQREPVSEEAQLKRLAEETIRIRETERGAHLRPELMGLFDRAEDKIRERFAKDFPEGQDIDFQRYDEFMAFADRRIDAIISPAKYLGNAQEQEVAKDGRENPVEVSQTSGVENTDRQQQRASVESQRENTDARQLTDYQLAVERDMNEKQERQSPGIEIGGR